MSRGCNDVVRGFLELRQDPNCIWTETGDSPLHLALTRRQNEVAKLLLISGADPNSANANGFTPLHIVSAGDLHTVDAGYAEREFVEMAILICNIKNQTLQIDAQDKLGRTPLQLAVASFSPSMVDQLLDCGADLFSFVFPTESQFGNKFMLENSDTDFEAQFSSPVKLLMTTVILAQSTGPNWYPNDHEIFLQVWTVPEGGKS
ncbi:hypothetical protein TKK_0015002 [Trichogramma kaykai]|uniref:Uncharacterized protein n=1 Tax=Trichogramma kaykai TaxID=54128 RepID=A0ABD2WDF0_9HYME